MSAIVGAFKRPYTQELQSEYEKDISEGVDEPEAKRRAQNRAAQRAFRERKEKHLKSLEFRLKELETESRSWKSTNMALRSQLMALEEELQRYRGGRSGPSDSASAPLNLKTEILDQVPSAQQRPYIPSPQSFSGSTPTTSGSTPPGASLASTRPLLFPRPPLSLQLDNPALQRQPQQPQPEQENNPQGNELPFVEPSMVAGGAPTADEFCMNLSLACGTRDKPIPLSAPTVAAELPTWQSPTEENSINAMNLFGGDANIPGLMTDDYSIFDPLEDIFDLAPQDEKIQGLAPMASENTPQRPPQSNNVSSGSRKEEEEVPASSSKFMTCSDVWDRICSHPRFGEIDIDGICAELRTRAKCSDAGVVLTETDLNEVLTSLHSS